MLGAKLTSDRWARPLLYGAACLFALPAIVAGCGLRSRPETAAVPSGTGTVQADYQRLCAIWRKTEPPEGQTRQPVMPEERSLLLAELDRRDGSMIAHDFRRMAAITLGNLKAVEAVPKLIALLNDRTEYDMVSAEAALALGKIGDTRALGHLLRALTDERSNVGLYAAQGLRALSPDEVAVKRQVGKGTASDLLESLARIKLPESEDEWLRSPSTASNRAWGVAIRVDAVCTGLNLLGPDALTRDERERATDTARALLLSGFPAVAYENHHLREMTRFCRTHQPELLATKLEEARRSPPMDTGDRVQP